MPVFFRPQSLSVSRFQRGGQALSQWLVRRSEERRAFRQLVMQAAIENWRHTAEAAREYAKTSKRGVTIYPLDGFIIHMLKLVEVLDSRRITPERVRKILREVKAVGDAASEEIDRTANKPNEPDNAEQGRGS